MWIKYGQVLIFPCKTESLVSEPVYEDSGVDIIAYKHTITVTGYINMSMLSIQEDKILVNQAPQAYYQSTMPSPNLNELAASFARDNTPVSTLSIKREQDFSFHQTISALCRYMLAPRRRLFVGATKPPDNAVLMSDDDLYRHHDIVFVSPESPGPYSIDNFGGPMPIKAVIDSIVHKNFAKIHWTCTWYSDPRRYRPANQDGKNFRVIHDPHVMDPISSHRYSTDIAINEHGLTQITISSSLTLNPGYYIDQNVYKDFDITKHRNVIPVYVLLRVNLPSLLMFRRTSSTINISLDGRRATITTVLTEVPYLYMEQDRFGINHIDVSVRSSSQLPLESSSSSLIDLEATYRAYFAPYAHPHDVSWFLYRILNHGLYVLTDRLKKYALHDFRKHNPDFQNHADKWEQTWNPKILLRSTSLEYDYHSLTANLRAHISIFDIAITMILYKGGKALFQQKDESLARLLLGQTLVYTAIQLLKSTIHDVHGPRFLSFDNSLPDNMKYAATSFEQSHYIGNRQGIEPGAWTNKHIKDDQPTFNNYQTYLNMEPLQNSYKRYVNRPTTNYYIDPLGGRLLILLCPISYHNISDFIPPGQDDTDKRLSIPPVQKRNVILL